MLNKHLIFGTVWAIALGFSSLGLADEAPTARPATTQPAADANVPDNFTRVALTATKDGHYLCPGVVEKQETPILIDSGAGNLIIDMAMAKKLNKTLTPAEDGTAANRVAKFFKAHFDEVRVARIIRVANQNLSVTDFSQSGKIVEDGKEVEFGGAIGSPPLIQLGGVLDYQRSLLLFPKGKTTNQAYSEFATEKGWKSLKLVRGTQHDYLFAPMTINGKPYAFLVDSGSGINTIEPAAAKALNLGRVLLMKDGKPDSKGAARYQAPQVKLADHDIGPVIFLSLESHVQRYLPKGHELGGILGTRTLKSLGGKVDFGSMQLFFEETPAKSTTTP